jgi:mitochondrial fission protein ELM1
MIFVPNIIRPLGVGINFKKSDNLVSISAEDVPDVIVSAGRRSAGVALFLKKYFMLKFARKVKLITILNPNYSFKNFDLVILPMHDIASKERKNTRGGNVMYINGSLCEDTIKIPDSVRNYWQDKFAGNGPFFSLIVGGNTKNGKIDPHKFAMIVEKLSNYTGDRDGTLLVSTSRRTSAECLGEIGNHLKCRHHIYDWSAPYSIPNPYYLFIEKSSIVFLTGDSISMISEIFTVNKPAYVYMPYELTGKKHSRFLRDLLELGVIREIKLETDKIEEFKSPSVLNELRRVTEFIKNNILNHVDSI